MKTKLCLVYLFLFIFLSASFVSAQNIPNLPVLEKYVNDKFGILSESEISEINSLAAEIERNSTVQVAVLIINSTQPYEIEEYANQVFRANGIGQKENNNGILIVVAIFDRMWRIEVGYGLEGLINDAKAGNIGRDYLVPYFRNGQYAMGISYAVEAIGRIVQGQPEVIAQDSIEPLDIFIIIVTLIVTFLPVIIILIIVFRFGFYRKCPRDGTRMKMRETKDEVIYECPKCHYKKKEKKRRRFFWFFYGGLHGGRWSSSGGGGGGGFGGGSSGGGGAGGGW